MLNGLNVNVLNDAGQITSLNFTLKRFKVLYKNLVCIQTTSMYTYGLLYDGEGSKSRNNHRAGGRVGRSGFLKHFL